MLLPCYSLYQRSAGFPCRLCLGQSKNWLTLVLYDTVLYCAVVKLYCALSCFLCVGTWVCGTPVSRSSVPRLDQHSAPVVLLVANVFTRIALKALKLYSFCSCDSSFLRFFVAPAVVALARTKHTLRTAICLC